MTKMAKVLDVVQLSPKYAEHCGFKFGQVTQPNDDGSVFVTGKIGDGGGWFVGAGEWQQPDSLKAG